MSPEAPISAVDIEQVVRRFEGDWQRGEQPAISDYCKEIGPGSNALLQAIVVVDLECRLRLGQRRSAEDYLREFPQLQWQEQTILALLRVEARWHAQSGPPSFSDPEKAEGLECRDAGDQFGPAAVETVSGTDLSVVAATRTGPSNPFSEPDFSGLTASAHGPPPAVRLPAVRMLGRFRLVDVIGQGGFGTVFRAIDTGLGRVVAVKVPKEGVLGSEKEQERFIREAQSAAALRHDHIVRVFEVGGTRERPFIVSEFVPGCTLSKALTSRQYESREAAATVRLIANALHYAHERGVVHRDVKPSNIMLDDVGKPHLMDFGLARREGEVLITIAGQIMGTPAYMSPEQAEGRTAGAKSDIYSLGVVLYELLTGQRPFQGNVQSVLQQVINAPPPSPIVANRAVPRDLEKICLKCMQKLPADRYESARELEEDLSRFLEGLPVRARPISLVARNWRWARRHPKTVSLMAVALLLAVSLPILQVMSNRRLDREKDSARRAEDANRARLEKLFVSKGNERIEPGNPIPGLPWFAAAFDQLPDGAPSKFAHRTRLVTNMEGQHLVHLWRARGPINSVARCPTQALLAIAPAAKTAMVIDLTRPDAPVLLPHPQPPRQCGFSPDGRRLAISCMDDNVRIWRTSALSSPPLVLAHDHEDPTWMEFDPGGRLLASATNGGAVRIWDVATGNLLAPILSHSKTVNHLAFNSDGSILATACSDGAAHVWSVQAAREVAVLKHERDLTVNCVAFAPRGEGLYSGGEDGKVRAWNAKTKTQQFELNVASPVLHLAFSPDGTRLAAGCRDGRVCVWNVATRALLGEFRHEQQVSALSFSGTNNTLVTGSLDQTVRVWDVTTDAAAAPRFLCAGGLTWVELARDRQHLMSAGLDGILREWSLGTPFKTETRCAEIDATSIVQLSANGRWLLLKGTRGPAQLCDLSDPKLVFVTLVDSSTTCRAAFTTDGNRLVLAASNGDLDLWDVAAQPRHIRLKRGNGPITDVGFSPDGQSLVTAHPDGTARVCSVAGDEPVLTFPHGNGLKRALYSSDGGRIYTVGRTLFFWDIRSRKLLTELQRTNGADGEINEIDNCCLTANGRLLLAIRPMAPAVLYDAATGAPLRPLKFPTITGVFSADGTRLVTTDSQNQGSIWDVGAEELARTGSVSAWPEDKPVPATSPHRGPVTCCAIRADGALIATGSDETARVWDAETGEPVSPPFKHSDRVIFVGFRESGNQLVTVSADAVIRLWTLDDGSSSERLIHLAKAMSGQQIDENGTAVALKPAQIEAEWNAAHRSPDSP